MRRLSRSFLLIQLAETTIALAFVTLLGAEPDGRLARQGEVKNSQMKALPEVNHSSEKPTSLLMEKTWEPNEKAYWFLKPKDWLVSGGIVNINPLQMNGPGNTLAPKNDLAVKRDEAGTVMFRWAPVWYYADFSKASSVYGGFVPGSYYRGMLVKAMPTAKNFLLELLQRTRPDARNIQVVAEDPLPELVKACEKTNQALNQSLVQSGFLPNSYSATALLVEYAENGRQFREALVTVIVDARASAFSWNNERTVMLRAPTDEYAGWKTTLDIIRTSDHMNPEWVANVNRHVAARTKMAQETDRYMNRVANEIVANRRKTNAELRHEQWLFISGQEEYKNPFTGEIERDTSAYRHRWVNNRGDIILTDQNDFDPNEIELYKTREWKPSQIWDRKNAEHE